ncbi:MAG TPA: hypothetical protein VLU43_17430 [Anaeromyxobacteraceae bacterium]|nr:hypothetical protein [Anaeromyxobacteraceae bacterium]
MIGDHIRALKGGRWAHAIDCGDATVLHVVEDPAVRPGDRIRRTYRPEFIDGAQAVEIVTHRERVYPPRSVVARAYSRLADAALASMFRDSEAFAWWCKAGRLPGASTGVALAVQDVSARTAPRRAPPPGRTSAASSAARAKPVKAKQQAKAKRPPKARPAGKASSSSGSARRKPAAKKRTAARRPAAGKAASRRRAKPR